LTLSPGTAITKKAHWFKPKIEYEKKIKGAYKKL
jgi:hypothetical protein